MVDNEPAPSIKPKAQIFISHSRKDIAFADRIEAALKVRGFAPLIDRTEIYAFEEWWKRIEALIVKADTIIFVLTPEAVVSDICAKEVTFAASLNKRFAPIVYRPVIPNLIPGSLARLNFIFFDDETRFDESMAKLKEALTTDIEWVRKHTEFGEVARRWEAAGRTGARGLLLRSPVLEEAEAWIAVRPTHGPQPTEATHALIVESRRATTLRRSILTFSLAVGLVAALGLAGFAYLQRNEAQHQRGIAMEQRSVAEGNEKQAREQRNSALLTQSRFLADLASQRAREACHISLTLAH